MLVLQGAMGISRPLCATVKYINFIKRQDCCNCSVPGPCDPHHLPGLNRTRRKDDTNTIPLCRTCHRMAHDNPGYEQWNLNVWMETSRKLNRRFARR